MELSEISVPLPSIKITFERLTLDPNATTEEPLKLDASFGAGRLPMVVLLAVIVILMFTNTTSPIRKYPPQLTVALVRVGTVKAVGNLLFYESRRLFNIKNSKGAPP